ncbi:aryl-alcohol dehydrogenase-like predicted oxidoreductase [Microcella alkaliphila]|uniref:Aryl-alcohol dehydrogenase-like predicted oxidoreductase n=1 Tax=Microcella alkaliphila TaxID=279828 RepID=A0A4Q7TG03_9MICO|nr:aldo/keto reductase [Microcella alkaliphila]RZT59394.1 aryl-alcohol dehydrogenase-like predicted oxidoreductase [Microcella alkaliphila]
MRQRLLGHSGTAVSDLALGTMTFGAESDEATSHAILDAYAAAGGTLIDTADVYSAGESERIVGRWLAANPDAADRMIVATKGRFPMGKGPNDVGLSRRHLRRALAASLERLGVDHVDLYQFHAWDPLTPVEETLRFADDAIRAGDIAYYGWSNLTGWQLAEIVHTARAMGVPQPVTLQPQYNLLARELEFEVVPAAERYDVGLLPWGPLAGGWLTGKYTKDARPSGATRLGENPDRGMEAYDRKAGSDRTWAVLDVLTAVAAEVDASCAQVALAWLVDRPAVTSVILGARTVGQLEANMAAASVTLSADQRARLDTVSAVHAPDYPYGELGIEQRSRSLGGGR